MHGQQAFPHIGEVIQVLFDKRKNGGGAATPSAPKSKLHEKTGHLPHNTRRSNPKAIIFVSDCGYQFIRAGKGGRVLSMLARMQGGITQWDTLPWHTRLGGTIHALRREGLSIVTEIEGPYRHARYRLATAGRLLEPGHSQ